MREETGNGRLGKAAVAHRCLRKGRGQPATSAFSLPGIPFTPHSQSAPRVGDACRSHLQFMVEEEPSVMWGGGQLLGLQGKEGIRKSFVTRNSRYSYWVQWKKRITIHLEKHFLGHCSTNYLFSLVPSSLTKTLNLTKDRFFDFATPLNNGPHPCRHQTVLGLVCTHSLHCLNAQHTVRCILTAFCLY